MLKSKLGVEYLELRFRLLRTSVRKFYVPTGSPRETPFPVSTTQRKAISISGAITSSRILIEVDVVALRALLRVVER